MLIEALEEAIENIEYYQKELPEIYNEHKIGNLKASLQKALVDLRTDMAIPFAVRGIHALEPPIPFRVLHGKKFPEIPEFIYICSHPYGDVFVRSVDNDKYIAFYLEYDKVPRVRGLTDPVTKKDMEELFGIIISEIKKVIKIE